MAQPSNKARVGEAFDLLATGLLQFVDVRMKKTVFDVCSVNFTWSDLWDRGEEPA